MSGSTCAFVADLMIQYGAHLCMMPQVEALPDAEGT